MTMNEKEPTLQFRFHLRCRPDVVPAGELADKYVVLELTQAQFEDHQALRDDILPRAIRAAGWGPATVHWSPSPSVAASLMRDLEQRFAGCAVLLYYAHSYEHRHYKQGELGGLPIRFLEFQHGIKVAPEYGWQWPDANEEDSEGPASFGIEKVEAERPRA